jgi:hypothetical protein
MDKLQKIARRQLRRANEYRKAGDNDAANFAMYWYERTARRISRAIDAAFAPSPFAEAFA